MAVYPTTSLKPGQSGPEVKKLQEYLVSQGFMTQAEMNTGPGIYGPKTKAAVAKLQQSLGVETAGNPGYWGPRTLEKIKIGEAQQLLERGNVLGEQVSKQTGIPLTPTSIAPVSQVSQPVQVDQFGFSTESNPNNPGGLSDAQMEAHRQLAEARSQTQRTQDAILPPTQSQPVQQDDANTIALLTKILDQLTSQNKVINPSVVISDAQILEFLRLAEEEVTPFYQAQLRTAREGLYRNLGYASDEVLRNEQQLEKKYGLRVRQIGEEQAERGFAQSGRRLEEEQLLREETAEQIGAGRRGLEFGAGTAARQFAQQFGAAALPSRTLEERPGVISGIPAFTRTGAQRPLYELSDDVYRGLVGSQEKERLTGIRALAQQREELTRTGQATPVYSQFQPRALTF